MIQHASSLSENAKLRSENPCKYQTGSKVLVPLSLGSHVLYDKNPDNSTKGPEWSKEIVTNINDPGGKYIIETDTGKYVTRTRQNIRPDGLYVTNSGRVSRPPERLIVKM